LSPKIIVLAVAAIGTGIILGSNWEGITAGVSQLRNQVNDLSHLAPDALIPGALQPGLATSGKAPTISGQTIGGKAAQGTGGTISKSTTPINLGVAPNTNVEVVGTPVVGNVVEVVTKTPVTGTPVTSPVPSPIPSTVVKTPIAVITR